MRVALKFGYNGLSYHGYARQPHLPTIEGSIISHLQSHDLITTPTKAQLRSASRTDKGVSSLGNVIAFNTKDAEHIDIETLNKDLFDIFFTSKHIASDDFYPRYANSRRYQYFLLKKDYYCTKRIQETFMLFVGTHDFSNFARIEVGKNPVRTIDEIRLEETADFLIFSFCAQTYLWNQIRRIISAILQVEERKTTQKQIQEALDFPMQKRDFRLGPSYPLILTDVHYDNLTFTEHRTAKKNKDALIANLKNYIKNQAETPMQT